MVTKPSRPVKEKQKTSSVSKTAVPQATVAAQCPDDEKRPCPHELKLLAEERARYLDLYDHAPVAFCTINIDGLIVEANLTASSLLEVTRESLINQPISLFFVKEDQATCSHCHEASFATGETKACELQMIRSQKEPLWVQLTSTAALKTNGQPVCRIAIIDISERKKIEKTLHLQSLVLDQITDQVAITDLNGVISYINQAELKVLQRPRDKIVNRKTEIFGENSKLGATQREILEKTLQNGQWRGEVINYAADGSEHIMDCRTKVVCNEKGEKIALCGISTEITEQKRLEAKLQLQSKIQEVLLTISSTYINMPINKIDEAINASLNELGMVVGADRSFLLSYDFDYQVCNKTHEWSSTGKKEAFPLKDYPLSLMPDWVELHQDGKTVYIEDISRLSPDSLQRQKLEQLSIKSLIAVPLMDGCRCLGCVGFDTVNELHTFTEAEQKLFTIFAQMLVNVRVRYEMEDKLLRREALLAAAAQIGQMFLSTTDLRQILGNAMCLIGEASGQDRAYYFERDPGSPDQEPLVSLQYEWVAQGISPQLDNPTLKNIAVARVSPVLFEKLCSGKSVSALTKNLQPGERVFTDGQGIKSLLLMPVLVDNLFHGFIGLDNCSTEYSWTPGESAALSIIAAGIGASTSRFRAEAALLESESRYRAVSERSHTAICIINDEGKFTWCNDKLIEMGGYPRELIYQAPSFASFIAPESVNFTVENFQKALSGLPYAQQYRFNFIRADGQKRICDKHMMDFLDIHGRRNVIISMHDVTDQIEAEERKANLETQLQHAQKMESVGRLAGGVAHDFNNMLGAILGNVGLVLQDLSVNNPLRENIEEIEKCAKRSAELTRQLLAFARKQTVEPQILDMNSIVSGMLRIIRRLIGEDIELSWLPGKNLWPVEVDPSQIDQMLANLCVNSRDAIGNVGKVTIETSNARFDEAYCARHPGFFIGEYVMVAVSDNGCGMDNETLAHLFEPFFTTKEVGKGTGLGLATVYGAVRQNNGFIIVNSKPGQGTTFKIYLPRHHGESRHALAEEPVVHEAGGNETILLVEDEPSILRMTTMVLKRQGYTILSAATPVAALQLVAEYHEKIDLLITDVVMPQMNGRELAKKLAELLPGIKCLYMSGYTADIIAHHGVLVAGLNFIQKPFSLKELSTKVREVLESNTEYLKIV